MSNTRIRKPIASVVVLATSLPDAVVSQVRRASQRELVPKKERENRFYKSKSEKNYERKKKVAKINTENRRRLKQSGAFSNYRKKVKLDRLFTKVVDIFDAFNTDLQMSNDVINTDNS